MLNNIDGIYVVHAPVGYELHEKRVIDIFNKLNFEFEFVTDADPELVDELLTTDFVKSRKKGLIMCTLSHLMAYQKVVTNGNKYALIFEDDPFFIGDFKKKMVKLEPEILKLEPGFIISLENTTLRMPSFWQVKRKKYLYKAKMGRAAAAYIIDYKAAEIMLAQLNKEKCHLVIDWWHNYLIKNNILDMYWAHPPFVEQGSHNGEQSAPKSTQQRSIMRKINWKFQKLYKYGFRRLFNNSRIID
ncbi:MAG: glycosyltransferase family 25 protein [Marinilabiliaceae bacterium]|nr:glycosyltransferase family 25 protein [Marinilabiliaceae bacterium]